MSPNRAVGVPQFAKEMVAVGIIPEDMLNDILDIKILLNPQEVGQIQITLVMDERIYQIMDPKVRKMFTVEVPGK